MPKMEKLKDPRLLPGDAMYKNKESLKSRFEKLFETMAKAGDLTKADLDFAFRMGYHTGKIEVLEERVK